MCLIVPALVRAVDGCAVEVDMQGVVATVDGSLLPDVAVGQYVLVDRGLVLSVIEPSEAAAIMAIYAEMEELLGAAPAGGAE
jgi:hydrogenase assembly chaperone HypC/HupF